MWFGLGLGYQLEIEAAGGSENILIDTKLFDQLLEEKCWEKELQWVKAKASGN